MDIITEKEYNEVMATELQCLKMRVKRRMADKRISIYQVSKATGICYSTCRQFMLGNRLPDYKTISRIRYYVSKL